MKAGKQENQFKVSEHRYCSQKIAGNMKKLQVIESFCKCSYNYGDSLLNNTRYRHSDSTSY